MFTPRCLGVSKLKKLKQLDMYVYVNDIPGFGRTKSTTNEDQALENNIS